MTVSSIYDPDTYLGDGILDTFAITFNYLDVDSNVKVSIKVNSTGIITEKTAGIHYNVDEGNVVFTEDNEPENGETIIIELNPDFQQNSDYKDNSSFPAETLEADFDERCLESQFNKDSIARSFKIDASESLSGINLAIGLPTTDDEVLIVTPTGLESDTLVNVGLVGIPVPVNKGGTGNTTLTPNSLLTGNGTGAINSEVNITSTSGDLTVSNGSDSAGKILFKENSSNGILTTTLKGQEDLIFDATITLPSSTDTLVGRVTTDTLENKTIDTANNNITIVEADISDLQDYLTLVDLENLDTGSLTTKVNQVAHGFVLGDWVRLSGVQTYAKAKADSVANAEVIGVVSDVEDVDNFTISTGGRIDGLLGLTPNEVYFLDPILSGGITAVEPTTIGEVSKPILIADSATSGYVLSYRGTEIGTGGGGGGLNEVVEDLTPQLGGDLDVNGNSITSTASIDLSTNSVSRADITDSGLRLGAANARVTTIIDDNDLTGASSTNLATAGSIASYAQGNSAACKGWLKVNDAGGIETSYNVTSVVDTGTGQVEVVWDTDFASSSYNVTATAQSTIGLLCIVDNSFFISGGSVRINCYDTANSLTDPVQYHITAYGEQ